MFGSLPLDSIKEILTYLDPNDLRCVARLNLLGSRLAKDNQIWKLLCHRSNIKITSESAFQCYKSYTLIPIFLCKMRSNETFKIKPFGLIKRVSVERHGDIMRNRMFDKSFMIILHKNGSYRGVKISFGDDTWYTCDSVCHQNQPYSLLWFPSFYKENISNITLLRFVFDFHQRGKDFTTYLTKYCREEILGTHLIVKRMNKLSSLRMHPNANIIDNFTLDGTAFKKELMDTKITFCDQFKRAPNMLHCRAIVVEKDNSIKMVELSKVLDGNYK